MLKRSWILLLVAVLATGCGVGNEADPETLSSPKVNLDEIVAAGSVSPVNGVTSAGQPDEEGFALFAKEGYGAVVDLRTDGEDRGLDEPAVVEGLGMEYVSMPIGRDDVTFESAAALFGLLEEYDEPVLVHCGSANRVGALFALHAFAETGDAELALEIGREAGMTGLEEKVTEIIEAEQSDQ